MSDGTDSIERTLELDAPPERVWRAITEPGEIARWFGDSAELALETGGEGWFGWERHGKFAVRIELWQPPMRFAWRWAREPGLPLSETSSTLVEWELVPRDDGGTTLRLRESGFLRPEDREQNVEGWRHELADLREHLEDGSTA